MKRLWTVEVEKSVRFTMAVVADNVEEARVIAHMNAGEEEENYFGFEDWDVHFAAEATDPSKLDAELLDSHPWGDDAGDLTCAEWLAKQTEPRPMEHAVQFCGGTWRLNDPWLVCDNCRAQAPASLANLDRAWGTVS